MIKYILTVLMQLCGIISVKDVCSTEGGVSKRWTLVDRERGSKENADSL